MPSKRLRAPFPVEFVAVAARLMPLAALVLFALPARDAAADVYVDLGLNASRVDAKIATIDARQETSSTGWHVGVGASRSVGAKSDFGVRLEFDDVDSNLLLAVRALDYRRNFSAKLAWTAFAGAARLDLATPAYGYYLGTGVQLKQIMRHWDLGVDLRVGDELARDNLLPSDPQGGSPDNFYSLTGLSFYLSYRF